MVEYIEHPMIKPEKIQSRIYQQMLFYDATKSNTLIILPTGLGKTIIMIMVIAHYLKNKTGKIVITAPTKPLVEQHHASLVDKLDIVDGLIKVLSGSSPANKRKVLWKSARVIVATPQTLRNDIVSGICDLSEIDLLCFDEVHRAVGDDPYVLSGEQYKKQNPTGRVLGFTASPKNKEKLIEIVENLNFQNVKYMDENDSRVKPYIHGTDKELRWLTLPKDFQDVLADMKNYQELYAKVLKTNNFIRDAKNITKKQVVDLPRKINAQRSNLGDDIFFDAMRAYGQIMLVSQAIEMLETQGITTLHAFFENKIDELRNNNKRSLKNFLTNDIISDVRDKTKKLITSGLVHPKLTELKKIIFDVFKNQKDSRVLIFANFKATINFLVDEIKSIPHVSAHRFVGQNTSSYGKGLKQKEQKQIMEQFKQGDYNVLVSSSVGEEGLDVAQCDYVIFYDITPSSTRLIQRSGRTGRARKGKVIMLITKKTRDEAYYYISERRKNTLPASILEAIKIINDKKPTNKISTPNLTDYFGDESTTEDMPLKPELKKIPENLITIIIDHREKGSLLIRHLMNYDDIHLEQRELPVGDFILSDRVGVERKTIDDFCNSVIDNRLFTQLRELQTTFLKPILLLEGNFDQSCRLPLSSFNGAISSILIDFNIPIIRTKDQEDTVRFLYSLAKREQRENNRKPRIRQSHSNTSIAEEQLSLISSLPNVNKILAERMLHQFKTPRKLFSAHPDDIRKVLGIGKNIAYRIDNLLNSPFNEDELE